MPHSKAASEHAKFYQVVLFIRKTFSWIHGHDIIDTCIVQNFGFEAPLPWPQVGMIYSKTTRPRQKSHCNCCLFNPYLASYSEQFEIIHNCQAPSQNPNPKGPDPNPVKPSQNQFQGDWG